ncbi:hypothetical protein RKD29_003354 [Streptomyces tendae]|uniref:GH3 auxin-responsive promoter family protein n=1 Tax=Streptomyces tendae TaxID=1932 RepID=UPI0038357CF2
MNLSEEWADRDRVRRYRQRVFDEREGISAVLPDAREQQRQVLREMVRHNADTEYGRAHAFASIREPADLRKAVPINDYAALSTYIERMAAGESGVLSADDPAVYFTSSGTTGKHKKIPVTPTFMRRTFFPFYYAAWAPLIEHYPDVLARPDAVLNLKHDPLAAPPTTASGLPHVGASQVDFGARFGEPLSAEPGTGAPWGVLPVPVEPDDHLEKAYLRLRLAAASDVRLVIGINPAMVAALPYQLRLWWPRLVREIHDGTLGGVPHTAPDAARARELERLAEHFGTVRPAHVWPRMRALFCWTTGMASLYLPRLREEFGTGVATLPAPVAASEGPVGVALDRHESACSLTVGASVYEFLDADEDLTPEAATLSWDELEAGRDYHVVFSHIGGLYRYAVGDVVHVVDRVAGVPRVSYAGRATRSSVAGERLREAQVLRALSAASGGTGLDVRNAACRVVDGEGGRPSYAFALASYGAWSTAETARFAALLDTAIGRESRDYRAARAEGRLGPVTVRLLDEEAFLRDWHAAVATGIRPTQVKDRLFRQDPALWERLTGAARPGRGGQ